MHRMIFIMLSLLILDSCVGQIVSPFLPKKINKNARYLFYLHGGSVTVLGDNSINPGAPEWGRYEYLNILDSLRQRGFNVISERRFENVTDSFYAAKMHRQIDTLLETGVPVRRIIVLSASSGWSIGLRVSHLMKNDSLHFVKIGGCRGDDYKEIENNQLHGKFLCIIEKTDSHGSCDELFSRQKKISSYKQVELNTGLNHGFFYKGRKEWINPIISWFNSQ
jgi:hypothetical protein